MKSELLNLVIVSIGAAAFACASADPGDPSDATGGVTSAGGAGSANVGANHGGSTSAGIVGGPGATVTCGTKPCSPPSASIKLYACCMPDDACGGAIPAGSVPGADFGGAATSPCLTLDPGSPDTSCQSYKSSFGVTLPGCCGVDRTCGVDLSVVGLGCNNISAIASDAGPPAPCGN